MQRTSPLLLVLALSPLPALALASCTPKNPDALSPTENLNNLTNKCRSAVAERLDSAPKLCSDAASAGSQVAREVIDNIKRAAQQFSYSNSNNNSQYNLRKPGGILKELEDGARYGVDILWQTLKSLGGNALDDVLPPKQ